MTKKELDSILQIKPDATDGEIGLMHLVGQIGGLIAIMQKNCAIKDAKARKDKSK